jgi:hypothetical protein
MRCSIKGFVEYVLFSCKNENDFKMSMNAYRQLQPQIVVLAYREYSGASKTWQVRNWGYARSAHLTLG